MRNDNVREVYLVNHSITVEQYIALLKNTSLGERRPLDDEDRIAQMLKHANITVSAWYNERLIGLARGLTDFSYCCYLSDLAVSQDWQRHGIGQRLMAHMAASLHPKCNIILLAAPKARDYYPAQGFSAHPSAWTRLAGNFVRPEPPCAG